jgi:hypothetical protein
MNPSTYNYIAIDVSKSTLQIQSESKAWKINSANPKRVEGVENQIQRTRAGSLCSGSQKTL